MAATTATLTTVELLEHIFVQLFQDPFCNVQVQSVCKSWRKIFRESPSVRRPQCVAPLVMADFPVTRYTDVFFHRYEVKQRQFELTPHYVHRVQINPALGSVKSKINNTRHRMQQFVIGVAFPLAEIRIRLPSIWKYKADRLRDFATYPPVSTMCLEVTSPFPKPIKTGENDKNDEDYESDGSDESDESDEFEDETEDNLDPQYRVISSCSMRVPGGITLGHVLQVQKSMMEAESKYYPHVKRKNRARPCSVYIMHRVNKDAIVIEMTPPTERERNGLD